jgi:hypothetical protein
MKRLTKIGGGHPLPPQLFVVPQGQKFDPARFPRARLEAVRATPPRVKPWPNRFVWTATLLGTDAQGKHESAWTDWLVREDGAGALRGVGEAEKAVFDVASDAQILHIRTQEDFERAFARFPTDDGSFERHLDWAPISRAYDAVHFGDEKTGDVPFDLYNTMYGWDVESTVWFDPSKLVFRGLVNPRERIPGGLAAGRRASEFDRAALARGTAVELEHTDDPRVAQEIAMDHLAEDPRYYEKLAKMEAGAPAPARCPVCGGLTKRVIDGIPQPCSHGCQTYKDEAQVDFGDDDIDDDDPDWNNPGEDTSAPPAVRYEDFKTAFPKAVQFHSEGPRQPRAASMKKDAAGRWWVYRWQYSVPLAIRSNGQRVMEALEVVRAENMGDALRRCRGFVWYNDEAPRGNPVRQLSPAEKRARFPGVRADAEVFVGEPHAWAPVATPQRKKPA